MTEPAGGRKIERFNERGEPITPEVALAPKTLVMDIETHQQLFWIDGLVVLPVGTVVELAEPNVDAVVERVRLLAGGTQHPVMVTLDVRVPQKYWDEIESEWHERFGDKPMPPDAWREILR